jgi:hypothetical protein
MSKFEPSKGLITKISNVPVTAIQALKIKAILAETGKEMEDLSQEDINSFRTKMREEAKAELEKDFELKKRTFSGEVGMTPSMIAAECNNQGGQKEFNSHEELIEYYRTHDKAAYEAIKKKAFSGMPEALKQSWDFKDTFDENGRSIIGRTILRANRDIRLKNGMRE